MTDDQRLQDFAERLAAATAAASAIKPRPGVSRAEHYRALAAAETAVADLYQEMATSPAFPTHDPIDIHVHAFFDAASFRRSEARRYGEYASSEDRRAATRMVGGAG